jgi:endonuclease/exonuclease/phosphatase family metal-dependent hydrolase
MAGTVKLVSWNIDGLSEIPLMERLDTIFSLLLSVDPDIILFQEVIPQVIDFLDQNLNRFGYFSTDIDSVSVQLPYFCRSYLKFQYQTSFLSSNFVEFPHSHMNRGYNTMILELESHSHLLILNTHLESCKESSFERKQQLQECFHILSQHNGPAILAGDLNLRDHEIKSKKEFPQLYLQNSSSSLITSSSASNSTSVSTSHHCRIIDCWEQVGASPSSRFTWFFSIRPDIRARYDRIYYKDENFTTETILSFDLLGKEIVQQGSISSESPYLSDHCGLVVSLQLPDQLLLSSTPTRIKRKHIEEKEESKQNLNYFDLTK